MTDFSGNIILLNDSAKHLFRIQKKFPYERKFLDYIVDPSVQTKLKAILKSSKEHLTEEITVPEANTKKCLLVGKNKVTTARGEVLGQVLVFCDISHERELEKAKDDFLHAITHDLKSPLTSIQGYLDLFLNDEIEPLSETQKKHMRVMSHSTQKILKMVNNLLDIAKIKDGHLTLNKGPWDPVNSVKKILTDLQAIYWLIHINFKAKVTVLRHGKKITSRFFPVKEVLPCPKVTLIADGSLLDRAISNLIDNALKHTPKNGSIEIHVKEEPQRVYFSIKDSGKGIPANALEKIFQKFQQLSATQGGTGLGLTFTRETVERHGGKISVTSKIGQGATFTFWIPK